MGRVRVSRYRAVATETHAAPATPRQPEHRTRSELVPLGVNRRGDKRPCRRSRPCRPRVCPSSVVGLLRADRLGLFIPGDDLNGLDRDVCGAVARRGRTGLDLRHAPAHSCSPWPHTTLSITSPLNTSARMVEREVRRCRMRLTGYEIIASRANAPNLSGSGVRQRSRPLTSGLDYLHSVAWQRQLLT